MTVGRLEPAAPAAPGPIIYSDCCQHAHARFEIKLPSGRILHFCGHHYNKHKWALGALGFEVKEIQNAH